MCSPCTTSALRFGTHSCHLMIQSRYIRRVVKRKQDTCGILQGLGETFFADTRFLTYTSLEEGRRNVRQKNQRRLVLASSYLQNLGPWFVMWADCTVWQFLRRRVASFGRQVPWLSCSVVCRPLQIQVVAP